MTKSAVTVTQLDGKVGYIGPSLVALAIAGTATKGPFTPQAFSRPQDVVSTYESGDLVHAACTRLRRYGGEVVCCRVSVTDVGEATLITTGMKATTPATPTVHAADLAPSQTLTTTIRFPSGGTRGTAGITYQISYDEGRTWGAVNSLGTGTSITLDPKQVGVVTIDFAAGSIEKDDLLIVNTVAPIPLGSETSTAVDALGKFSVDWDCLEVSFPIDAIVAGYLDTAIVAMQARGYYRYWIANAYLPTPTQTLAEYHTAMTTAWSSHVSPRGEGIVCYGNAHFVSPVGDFKQRRPAVWAVAPYIEALDLHIDPAFMAQNGPLPGVSLADDAGNPQLHDEAIDPGPDNERFLTLCTDPDYEGVYVTNAWLRSASGSDFRYVQHRRLMNRALRLLRKFCAAYLSKDVSTAAKTGRLLPSFARRFRKDAEAAVLAELGVGPKVDGVEVVPDQMADVLRTETLPVDFALKPKGYLKWIRITASFTATGVSDQ